MAKATITTPSGAKVALEGTSEEIAAVLAKVEARAESDGAKKQRANVTPKKKASGLRGHLVELIGEDFFKKPQEFGAVMKALAERGHYYTKTSLSPVMLRLTQDRELRRMKNGKRWVYVKGTDR